MNLLGRKWLGRFFIGPFPISKIGNQFVGAKFLLLEPTIITEII
jgi:hypothetical protein